ncbi:MAG: alkaline phosphatase D family protein [Woeseiaceae bacterium]
MPKKITRRQALLGASSALLLQAACSTTPGRRREAEEVFAHGIASGDPDTSSVVLWTRVSGYSRSVGVDWTIATDANFISVVGKGLFETHGGRDYTVNVIARNLEPGRSYYYRFSVDGATSQTGQTKTVPVGHIDRLVIAVASCSNYPFGYFNAYDDIANDSGIDLVAHLGDYIYEYDENGYGAAAGRRLGRIHEPRHETVTLADYRTRHAQYKSDAGSQAMHARHPLIAIWDDHESANNPWMGGAQNHQAEEGAWRERRLASLTAYYEWMPIRPPAQGVPMQNYWRHYKYGDLVSLITLESRHTGRDIQVEYGDLGRFGSAAEARAFYTNVVGAPARNYLSASMENFLAAELRESVRSGRRWRVIGNQSVMAKMIEPNIDTPYFAGIANDLPEFDRRYMEFLTHAGNLGLTGDLDSWSGYPAARERFYQVAKDAGANDLLVISGDSHSYWQNALYDDSGQSMGIELGTTGITSPRGLLSMGTAGLERYESLIAARNEEIVWANGRNNGYIRLAIDHDGARADYVVMSTIESRAYDASILRTAKIAKANGELRYV